MCAFVPLHRIALEPPWLRLYGMHLYEVRPHKDHRDVHLISDALPFGRLCYGEPNAISNAISYAKFFSRSHNAVIRVYELLAMQFERHEHAGEFKERSVLPSSLGGFGDRPKKRTCRLAVF
jgi:hypothetical protein